MIPNIKEINIFSFFTSVTVKQPSHYYIRSMHEYIRSKLKVT